MLNIAICDDEPAHSRMIETALKKHLSAPYDIERFTRAEHLMNSVNTDSYRPQIAVLDIAMEGMTGLELASELNKTIPECRIIFVTGYDEYAPAVYRTEHTWFIPKAELDSYIGTALNKAIASLAEAHSNANVLQLKRRGKTVILPIEDVLYMERRAHQTVVFTLEDEYCVTAAPGEILSQNAENLFIRCHQSYWVNRNWIQELVHDTFILKNGVSIGIGRTYRIEARNAFFEWLKMG